MEKTQNVLKEELRQHHISLRNAMEENEVIQKSHRICEILLREEWYQEAEVIYAYYPLTNEVDCRSLLLHALADGKRIALPKTRAKDCSMEFYRIESFAQLKEGNFHVMEPIGTCPILQEEEAIVLVPGAVFDKCGNRYGYRKGYYDRYFFRFKKLQRFAIAFEQQMEQQIETESTDVKMHRIYTEAKTYHMK